MKLHILAAASGLALSAFLMSSPAGAQGSYPAPGGDRVDANGMPTTHSTPQEKAQTADLNSQVAPRPPAPTGARTRPAPTMPSIRRSSSSISSSSSNIRTDAAAMRRSRSTMRIARAMYENLRARYAAERAAYHRDLWPERHWIDRGA